MTQGGNDIIAENDEMNTVKVRTKPCWICGQYSYLDVPWDAWSAYDIHNLPIETAWPQGPAEELNLLRTGVHTKCWDSEFPQPEET